ncbi:SpoIVB peptidase S55 domain-containing protein [Nocardioides sp. AX2bis]|uniref:SpoIVB peptidase S55 domain-containing protein n=1 Tax=Nocardioides sp. AX2bis TaxID=2653157 RepID=UPI0012EFF9A7|nr:SpoIVB peptidase S55 domain-containing protein [Nocardioides sp. AX2bis]VXB18105.1 conserved exported hypothetical protein [Nocardioides sp. AX2bis]
MSTPLSRSRARRRAAVATTSLAVVASSTLLALSGGQGSWAAPAEDCTEAFPVAEVAQGDAVTGLTVSDGTEPEGFQGEVIGVLEDGIAPGLDMVLARLSSPEIDRVGGIWQGMSGSPVYAADGRLIGAVAYGLSYGSSPVAGITPFEEMDDYLGDAAAPARVGVDGRTARAVAAGSDVSATQAEEGLSRLPMPVSVSGLSAQRLTQVQAKADKHAYLGDGAVVSGARVARGGAGAVAADGDDLVAGGNLAAAVYYGDIDAVGVGTVTSVCGDRVVGFGHPFSFTGDTTLSLHPAEALYIQEESLGAPFKVANAGAPVGTVTDDRLAGITSTFGPLPDSATITSTVSYDGRSRTGSTEVNLDEATAETTLYGVLANHDRVLDGITGGTELQTVEITGTNGAGQPFSVSYADRYTEQRDIAFGTVFDVANAVYSLSRIGGVDLDTVTVGSEIVEDTSVSRVTEVERLVSGTWTNLGRRNRAVAGDTVKLRATVTSSDGSSRTERFNLDVPRSAAGDYGYIAVGGGSRNYYGRSGGTLDKVLAGLEDRVRNDQVSASIGTYQRRSKIIAEEVGEPGDEVVRGGQASNLRIVRR